MTRRGFLKTGAVSAAATRSASQKTGNPNLILIVADQVSYGLTKATGFPLDTCPTLDQMGMRGVSFQNNYCTMPLCVPSRVSMLTGRWPAAHHVRMNLQPKAAYFEKDIYQVVKSRGYRTAMIGKNHTYLTEHDVDTWREYTHTGGPQNSSRSQTLANFDRYLKDLHFNVSEAPTPFPLESQLPYRIVSDAIDFIAGSGNRPFFLQVSIPEPHNPEQVPAPYWDMFPPDSIPARCGGPEELPRLGFRANWEYRMQQDAAPQTEKLEHRYRSNYLGSLRMIDDQIKRLLGDLEAKGLAGNTLIVFTTDHGDSLMNYGIGHKGLDVHETVIHTPQIWYGYGVQPSSRVASVFTSMADIMPTLCEAIGADIPHGVQGRSLWPLLQGESYPTEEFRSIISSVGLGGLYYEEKDQVPLSIAQDANGAAFDELNKVTLSGNQKTVRMGNWKLVFDMMGYGQMYNLRSDPCESKNLFDNPQYVERRASLLAELAMWTIRLEDSLPTGPQNKKYATKWSTQHNWYAPYRKGGQAPNTFVP